MPARDKRIAVSFPPDHEIWNYPEGQRASRVRELVDIALKMESKFAALDERLSRIEELLKESRSETNGESGIRKRIIIDPGDFLNL